MQLLIMSDKTRVTVKNAALNATTLYVVGHKWDIIVDWMIYKYS